MFCGRLSVYVSPLLNVRENAYLPLVPPKPGVPTILLCASNRYPLCCCLLSLEKKHQTACWWMGMRVYNGTACAAELVTVTASGDSSRCRYHRN